MKTAMQPQINNGTLLIRGSDPPEPPVAKAPFLRHGALARAPG